MRFKTPLSLFLPPRLLVAAACIQWDSVGLPTLAPILELTPTTSVTLHGFPVWLRVENQLGFKKFESIQAIELVEDVKSINPGEGGYAEDHENFAKLASI